MGKKIPSRSARVYSRTQEREELRYSIDAVYEEEVAVLDPRAIDAGMSISALMGGRRDVDEPALEAVRVVADIGPANGVEIPRIPAAPAPRNMPAPASDPDGAAEATPPAPSNGTAPTTTPDRAPAVATTFPQDRVSFAQRLLDGIKKLLMLD